MAVCQQTIMWKVGANLLHITVAIVKRYCRASYPSSSNNKCNLKIGHLVSDPEVQCPHFIRP